MVHRKLFSIAASIAVCELNYGTRHGPESKIRHDSGSGEVPQATLTPGTVG